MKSQNRGRQNGPTKSGKPQSQSFATPAVSGPLRHATHRLMREGFLNVPPLRYPISEWPLHLHHAGLAGWDIPELTALEYSANVIVDHRDAILNEVLPKLKQAQDRAQMVMAVRISEWLIERMTEPNFQFPQRFPLKVGVVRLRDWSLSDVQWQVLAMCAVFEPELRAVFLAPGGDPISALEWGEVLTFAGQTYARHAGGDDRGIEPSIDILMEEIALRAYLEARNYDLNTDIDAWVRRADAPPLQPAPAVAA